MTTTGYRWQTIAETFEQICHRKMPWIAIGNFWNDCWYFSVEHRRELVETPLPPAPTPAFHRWAAFCAAMVEWLCEQDDVACPAWTKQEYYVLSKPWFYDRKWTRKSWLLATTPAPFKRRNIYGGDRMFLGKRDLKVERVIA